MQNGYTNKDVNGLPLKYNRIQAERVTNRRLPRRREKQTNDFAKSHGKNAKNGLRKNLYKDKKIMEIKKPPGVNAPGAKEYFLSIS